MANRYFKIIVCVPSETIYKSLHDNLIYQNLEFFYLPAVAELEQYVQRMKPRLVLLHIPAEPSACHEALQVVRKLHALEDIWILLHIDKRLSVEELRKSLPVKRIVLQSDHADYQQLAHNILTIKHIDHSLTQERKQNLFEENVNQCLRIVYQEKGLGRIFERLVNYFPKIILTDYWGIFTMDKEMRHVEHFAQFIPPMRSKRTALTENLDQLSVFWLREGRPFLKTRKDDPAAFDRMSEWGWPVSQLYFLPIHLKDRAIGGIMAGNIESRQMNAQEIRFLNEVVQFISKRILDENLTRTEVHDVSDFSDQLITTNFDEDTIFKHATKKLSEVTHASSAVFWKYNKGFGFLFPKHHYFLEGGNTVELREKDMIFLKKENFLRRLIEQGKVQSIDDVSQESDLAPTTREIFAKMNYDHILIIPLKIHDEVTGALIVNKHQDRDRFNIWEIHKAEEIVKRTQKVIEDAKAVKEANLKLKQLSRIFELGKEIKLNLSYREILSRISQSLRKTLGWNDVAILLRDDLGENFLAMTTLGFNKTDQLDFNFSGKIPVEEFNNSLVDKCERIGNSFFLDSKAKNTVLNGTPPTPESPNPPGDTKWNDNDLLIVPLETRNKVMGYLVVHDPVDRLKPSLEKVIPLEYYANQAAIAVENSMLYEDLSASQERYRSLAETMSLGLVTCDKKGLITYVNPALQQLLAYQKEAEIVGHSLADFFPETSHEALETVVQQLLDGGSGDRSLQDNLEFDVISQSGEVIPVSVLGFPFFERRKKIGYFLIMNDLRVIKRMERMKADFNSMIVHDLRSPMNVIQGFIELIRNRVVGEINSEQEELLDIAKENVKKVLALVDNFLVASKLEVGKFSIEPKLDELNGLIRRQVDNHKVLTKSKNITISLDLDHDLPLLFFDSMRIDQVLNNLLSNAMKFTPEGGEIFVSSSLYIQSAENGEKRYVRVAVRDTGVGIPEDKLPRIFEKYEQVDENQAFNVRGTGLGLSICKEIISLHDGEIWVESRKDSGSEFIFLLPVETSIEKIVK